VSRDAVAASRKSGERKVRDPMGVSGVEGISVRPINWQAGIRSRNARVTASWIAPSPKVPHPQGLRTASILVAVLCLFCFENLRLGTPPAPWRGQTQDHAAALCRSHRRHRKQAQSMIAASGVRRNQKTRSSGTPLKGSRLDDAVTVHD